MRSERKVLTHGHVARVSLGENYIIKTVLYAMTTGDIQYLRRNTIICNCTKMYQCA